MARSEPNCLVDAGKEPTDRARAVASHLTDDEWFRQEVGKGLASRIKASPSRYEEVRRQMERNLGS